MCIASEFTENLHSSERKRIWNDSSALVYSMQKNKCIAQMHWTLKEWIRQLPNVRIPKKQNAQMFDWYQNEDCLPSQKNILVLHSSNIDFFMKRCTFLVVYTVLNELLWFIFFHMEDRLIFCVTVNMFYKPNEGQKVSCLARITIKQHLCCIALPFMFVLSSVCVLQW